MPPNSVAIDDALLTKLQADTALKAAMPDGVFWDVGPPNSTRIVTVSLVTQVDLHEFGKRSVEQPIYAVTAVALSTVANASNDVRAASARIEALLENGTLTAAGYDLMTMRRVGRIRRTEVDELDPSIRWLRDGGEYHIAMSVT